MLKLIKLRILVIYSEFEPNFRKTIFDHLYSIRNYGEDGKMVSEEIYDHGALISRKEIKADVASAADASASAVLVSGAKEIKPEPAKGAPQTQAPAPQTPPPAKK